MLIAKKIVAMVLAVFVSAAASAGVTIEGDPKVAFIYFSPKNDGGWTEAHERGRAKAAKALDLDIAYVENVPETCLLYTSPSPRDVEESRMPSSA